MNSAVIVAGGMGSRLGLKFPKQFHDLSGKEILSYSFETFLNHPKIQEVIIVTHEDWVDHVRKIYPLCISVIGGKSRQESSLNGVLATNINSKNILIHDAARPLISTDIIDDCLSALKNSDASAPILDSVNSLIELKGNQISPLNRQNIKSVQTPQCFKKDLILKVLRSSLEGTDEIGMLLNFDSSKKIQFVDGHANNIKITTKSDLIIALKIIEDLAC